MVSPICRHLGSLLLKSLIWNDRNGICIVQEMSFIWRQASQLVGWTLCRYFVFGKSFWNKNITLFDVTDVENNTQSDSEFQLPRTTAKAQAGKLKTVTRNRISKVYMLYPQVVNVYCNFLCKYAARSHGPSHPTKSGSWADVQHFQVFFPGRFSCPWRIRPGFLQVAGLVVVLSCPRRGCSQPHTCSADSSGTCLLFLWLPHMCMLHWASRTSGIKSWPSTALSRCLSSIQILIRTTTTTISPWSNLAKRWCWMSWWGRSVCLHHGSKVRLVHLCLTRWAWLLVGGSTCLIPLPRTVG